ncbi:MAG TPA: MerR family transcriptional regulator [Actinomycetes bacterium]|jgi:DNA-binding transcriptional MerR regulator
MLLEWTIKELASRAGAALSNQAVQPSARVRDVPDERLIRWYATIGLLDPPRRQGRAAWYGPRHLLQLVAIKRRQAAGRSLADIQAELLGATDEMLLSIADIPDAALLLPSGGASSRRSAAPPIRPERARTRFWAQHAARVAGQTEALADLHAAPSLSPPVAVRASADRSPNLLPALRLTPGVTLLLDSASRPVTEEDLATIDMASGPLLQTLADLGLLRQHGPTEGEPA